MLTWLDWYIQGASEGGSPADDLEAMRAQAMALLANLRDGVPAPPPHDETMELFFSALLPFLLTDEIRTEAARSFEGTPGGLPLGFLEAEGMRLSEDLVRAFAGEQCSDEVAESTTPLLREKNWYLDLPQRALMISDRQQIRAIFTQPSRDERIVIGAVLTRPGRNEITGRYFWQWRYSQEPPIGSDMETQDSAALRERVDDFVSLSLAYLQVAGERERAPLPRLDVERLRSLPAKKQKAKTKKGTLFSISDLRPPKDRFSKPASADADHHWSLSHRVEVRGHFRYQPHGPGRSLRKLIWIAPHQRGCGGKKPKLNILGN